MPVCQCASVPVCWYLSHALYLPLALKQRLNSLHEVKSECQPAQVAGHASLHMAHGRRVAWEHTTHTTHTTHPHPHPHDTHTTHLCIRSVEQYRPHVKTSTNTPPHYTHAHTTPTQHTHNTHPQHTPTHNTHTHTQLLAAPFRRIQIDCTVASNRLVLGALAVHKSPSDTHTQKRWHKQEHVRTCQK